MAERSATHSETQVVRRADAGFTLAELLIVIVILGILSTVTVFAVRGLTDSGQTAACDTEIRDLGTAQVSHLVLVGSYADEATLVANGALKSESSYFDVSLAADGSYSIAPAAGSRCTGTASGGGGGAATIDRSGYTVTPGPGGFTFTGVTAFQYNGGAGANEVLVFGRSEGELDWLDMINAAPASSRRVAFINLDNLGGNAAILNAMNASRTNGFTTFAIYPDDDPSGTAEAYIQSEIGVGPNSSMENFVVLDVIGGPNQTLTALLTSIG